jgi:chromosome segregation ATPase
LLIFFIDIFKSIRSLSHLFNNQDVLMDQIDQLEIISKKETARDLRKRLKRLEESRDGLQERNQQKSVQIKALSGKVGDLSESRERVKDEVKKLKESVDELKTQLNDREQQLREKDVLLQNADNQIEIERQLYLNKERERLDQIENFKKN